jgi:hypothetical protein
MLERRICKVDRAVRSTASGIAVLVASLFGHAGGQERATGDPSVDGTVLWQWRRPDRILEVLFDGSGWSVVLWCGAEVFLGEKPVLQRQQ